MTQELMHNYHLLDTMSKCVLKINIRKAFDIVNWEFILLGLRTIGVPSSMIRWIGLNIYCTSLSGYEWGVACIVLVGQGYPAR